MNPPPRRRSIRLPNFDYTEPGAYFVTICAHDRRLLFEDPWMKAAVERAWRAITGKRPTPYEFVVMPNHVHGIIWLGGPGHPKAQHGSNTDNTVSRRLGSRDGLPVKAGAAQLRRTVMPDSLGAKVRAFKAAVTRRINARRRTPGRPVWQEDYYEHVVRNEADLYRIRQYILDNPAKWADDPENPANARS